MSEQGDVQAGETRDTVLINNDLIYTAASRFAWPFRSGQKDVGDVSDDDFESQNRALSPSGRASGQTSKAGRTNSSSSVPRNSTTNKDPNPFVADGDENDTGSADQGLDSNSGMNKGEKEHCTDTAVQAVGRDAEMPAMRFSTCEPAERRRYV